MNFFEWFRHDPRMEKERRLAALRDIKDLAKNLKKRFSFQKLYLFGSLARGAFRKSSDIDLAIEGLPIEDFFKACAFLLRKSSFPVDLKPFEDLDEFTRRKVLREGKIIG